MEGRKHMVQKNDSPKHQKDAFYIDNYKPAKEIDDMVKLILN